MRGHTRSCMRYPRSFRARKFHRSAAVPKMKGITSLAMRFADAIFMALAASLIARLRYAASVLRLLSK